MNARSTTTASFPRVNHLQLLRTIRHHNTSFVIVIPARIPDTRVVFNCILTQTVKLVSSLLKTLKIIIIIQQVVQCFHIFLRPFNNYKTLKIQIQNKVVQCIVESPKLTYIQYTVVYILLGISPASNCSWPTFRNPVSVPSSQSTSSL